MLTSTMMDGLVLHCHVYTEGVGKKGANNVALLIMKTLQKLNLLCKDSVGNELNIIFDNCSGKNKNNTVLKLPAWLMGMGYFKEIHFLFLVVGNTKNVADPLFNSLKQKYRKQNLFTFDKLVRTLDKLSLLTIHPTMVEDFLNYSKLLDSLYRPLTGTYRQIKFSLAQMTVCKLRSGRAISRSTRSMSSTFGRGVHGME
jgi:hypothetical protein